MTDVGTMFRPDMTVSYAQSARTSTRYPQQLTSPTWGAIGSPTDMGPRFKPGAPSTLARKAVGMAGLGALGAYDDLSPALRTFWTLAGVASVGVSAYHGYKRNHGSIGWAIGWGLLGGIFPIITPAIAAAQGIGKPAKR